jgi:hypothetical protein
MSSHAIPAAKLAKVGSIGSQNIRKFRNLRSAHVPFGETDNPMTYRTVQIADFIRTRPTADRSDLLARVEQRLVACSFCEL